ncbi:MAG: OmpA family protein [Burkholderiales bacterium]
MTRQFSKPIFAMVAVANLGMGTSAAFAQTPSGVIPYLIDQRGVLARSGTGLCWRTGYWTPKLAAETILPGAQFPVGCECDKDLMPKEVCEPPPPPIAAKPAPEPVVVMPEPTPPPPPEHITFSADAFFTFNRAVLHPRGRLLLSNLADQLKSARYDDISVIGHADRLGTPAYNQKLSEERAAAVKSYLIDHGVPPQKIHSEGKGETEPVTTPDQCKGLGRRDLIYCLQPDRRVDIDVKYTKERE